MDVKVGRKGRRRLTVEREEFFRLVGEGVGVVAACARVGVSRKTGVVWRRECGLPVRAYAFADPALSATRAARMVDELVRAGAEPGRYLDLLERIHIADRCREGASVRQIAGELGRAPSTVSRELRRNRKGPDVPYRAESAQYRAEARRPRPKPCRIMADPVLRDAVQSILDDDLSPEQVSNCLRRHFPNRPEMHVCTETVYQTLYVHGRGLLRRDLKEALRTGRAARKSRRAPDQRTPRFRDPMTSIHDRPAEIADRAVPGHWEGDLIIGKNNASALATLVERTTRYTLVVPLPGGYDSASVQEALTAAIKTLPRCLTKSLTWDQGVEMARHLALSIATDIDVYFCDPHSPWQRGTNENTNGLLRQYFPKGTDLSAHSAEHIAAIAAKLNRRPRKTLNWDSPNERLAKLLSDHMHANRCNNP